MRDAGTTPVGDEFAGWPGPEWDKMLHCPAHVGRANPSFLLPHP